MAYLDPTFRNRTDEEDVATDVAAARGTTVEERAQILVELCDMAAEQVAQHPDPQRTLKWQDPISAESKALLARLRARHKSRG
ncbi:MAG: hypothetical protein V3T05_14475 [Myxococcota bacterium]